MKIISIILIFIVISGFFSFVEAKEDNFGLATKFESQHFIIYYPQDVEIDNLLVDVDLPAYDRFLVGNFLRKEIEIDLSLGEILDVLFLKICNFLDMPLYSFRITLKICRDRKHLEHIYNYLFSQHAPKIDSFYVYNSNTIYITPQNFKIPLLGREIAKAIISNYFATQPPIKVQEILIGYVEYLLEKEFK